MLLVIVGLVTFLFFIRWLAGPDPVRIVGIYGQPGKWYWLKFRLMRFVIGRRQKKQRKATPTVEKDENLMNSQWGGDGGDRKDEDMETKHTLPKDKKRAIDAVFFDASNKDGWYFTLGTAQRHDDIINLFCVIKIPGLGTFVNTEMYSSTNVPSLNVSNVEWRTASGFSVRCVEPMKKWHLSFKGKLAVSPGQTILTHVGPDTAPDNLETIDVEFDLDWNNFGEVFDFDKKCSPTAIAHSLAIEPWSRELFDKMRASHQTHYEQFGDLAGNFVVGDQKFDVVKMRSMRDHTIAGHRDWMDLRRYIMMIYHLEDGTCIHTSVISMPETVFSHLEFGYIVTPEGKSLPVDRIHFSLPNHGEDKHFPNKFHYSFEAAGKTYQVDVHIIETVSFKMGLDLGVQVNENMATFVCNGVRGWGFSECEYRIAPY